MALAPWEVWQTIGGPINACLVFIHQLVSSSGHINVVFTAQSTNRPCRQESSMLAPHVPPPQCEPQHLAVTKSVRNTDGHARGATSSCLRLGTCTVGVSRNV